MNSIKTDVYNGVYVMGRLKRNLHLFYTLTKPSSITCLAIGHEVALTNLTSKFAFIFFSQDHQLQGLGLQCT